MLQPRIFDNIGILATLKFIKVDAASYNKKASTFWFLALVANLALAIKELVVIQQQSASLKKYP